MSNVHAWVHQKTVYGRRVRQLADAISPLLDENSTVLDVGCGNGVVSNLVQSHKPSLRFEGLEVVQPQFAKIPVKLFDGTQFPVADQSYDYVIFIDVLHHTLDPTSLLKEAKRVASKGIIIKDHYSENLLQFQTLKLMDWFGNQYNKVPLPYRYLSRKDWNELYSKVGLKVAQSNEELGLYAFPLNVFFERGLHFVNRLNT